MKKILYLLIALLPLGLNADKMKVPFSVEVDFSKKGTVFETDFQAPWNIWGSLVSFNIAINYLDKEGYVETRLTNEQMAIWKNIRYGIRNGIPTPKEKQQYFKLKVTLTPLGWASDNIKVFTIDHTKIYVPSFEERYTWLYKKGTHQRKMYKDGEKIEFTISIPLYGGDSGSGGKRIMIADLQRLRNYHIRVESLEDIELPKDVKITFDINRHSRKV